MLNGADGGPFLFAAAAYEGFCSALLSVSDPGSGRRRAKLGVTGLEGPLEDLLVPCQ